MSTPTGDEQTDWRDKAWNAVRIGRTTPTDDERVTVDVEGLDRGWGTLDQRMAGTILAVIAHYGPKWREASGGDQANEIARALQASGFHRPPEPGSRLDLAFREELVAYSKNRIAESWGESVNGVEAETLARQIVGAQEWMWIARGFPVESTEVPEPSAEPKHDDSRAEWCKHCRVCGEGIRYGARCREHYQNRPETQAEPSDAQALETFLGKLAGDGAYTLDFTSAVALHGHIVRLLKRDIAALRAARENEIRCDYCGAALPGVKHLAHVPTTPDLQLMGFDVAKVVCPARVERARAAGGVR